MKKREFRPTPSMVVACVALFVALGGTGLAATYVVSSNSQIGPGTVSGHKPPTGKHANIVPGSVNNVDLAANAVNGGKVADNSLTGADVNESMLNGSQITGVNAATLGGQGASAFAPASSVQAVRVPFNDPVHGDNGFPGTTLVDTGPIKLTGDCAIALGGGSDFTRVEIAYTNASVSSEALDGTTNSITGGTGQALLLSPTGSNLDSAHFIAVPTSGQPISGFVSAELDDADSGSDCVFGVDLVGG